MKKPKQQDFLEMLEVEIEEYKDKPYRNAKGELLPWEEPEYLSL